MTGGSRGIGLGISRCLAEEGASVAVADVDGAGSEEAAASLRQSGADSLAVRMDVRKEESVRQGVGETLDRCGCIDILVNNAGALGGMALGVPLTDISVEHWDRAYEVNVRGTFLTCREVVPHMKERRQGKILNVSSRAGRDGRETLPHYGGAKAAVINFTMALAKEMAPYFVNVNAVCPGLVWTPMWSDLGRLYAEKFPQFRGMSPRQVFEEFVRRQPLQREQTPEDIGRAAVFLVSEDARNITGQALLVDGGSVMY
ncbi:MAG: SDR family oxidoreductase [Candidatus Tectomicrobia bacterium]|nr:SDR family oxidoreductase [Candidatus Tectomicrobia bacterium]